MTKPIQIGSTFKAPSFITPIVITSVFVVIGIICFVQSASKGGVVFLGLAAFTSLFILVAGIRISKGRRWLIPTPDGMTLRTKRGEFDFLDNQITDLGTWVKARYSNGVPKANTRTGVLVLDNGEFRGQLPFQYEYGLNEADPLTEFISRNFERLVQENLDRLAAGEELHGEKWVLDRQNLILEVNKQEEIHPIDSLTAIDVIDGKVCIWTKGDLLPLVKIPGGSANALVLNKILTKRIAERPNQTNEDDGTLGRIIFERNKSHSTTGMVIAAVIVLGIELIALFCFVSGFLQKPMIMEPFLIELGVGVLGLFIGLLVWITRVNIFRCHAFGVSRITSRKGERSLRFADIRVFNYSATRMYTNGAYTGTNISMAFEPKTGPADGFVYATSFKNADDELDNLRDHISKVVAGHMLKRLQDGKTVLWTDRVRFTQEGLEISGKKGVFNKIEDQFIPYAEIATFQLEQGVFYLAKVGSSKWAYQTPVSTSNFFPGLQLLILIRFNPETQQQPVTPQIVEDAAPAPEQRSTRRLLED